MHDALARHDPAVAKLCGPTENPLCLKCHGMGADTDDRFAFTYTTPGTYRYFCSLHPHMQGTVVVR